MAMTVPYLGGIANEPGFLHGHQRYMAMEISNAVGSSDFMTTYKYRETYNVVERARRQAKS
jgi:hypothetical protein